MVGWNSLKVFALAIIVVISTNADVSAQPDSDQTIPDFAYDTADETIVAATLGTDNEYDADVVSFEGALWCAWLQYTHDEGDRIWLGIRDDDRWIRREPITPHPGKFARPTLTADAAGRLSLSYESELQGQWEVYLSQYDEARGAFAEPQRISQSLGPDINHRVAADAEGGLWIVWQSAGEGQFDILARHVPIQAGDIIERISDSPSGDWHPHPAVTPDGSIHVAWDSYNGNDFDVLLRTRRRGEWGEILPVASSPAFEARAQIAPGPDNTVWIAWEEGSVNWGHPFFPKLDARNRPEGVPPDEAMDDLLGPLHTYRLLRMAGVLPDGSVHPLRDPLPMPSADTALGLKDRRANITLMGTHYERSRVLTDRLGRLWVAYRHYRATWYGFGYRTHVENGWGVYARCLSQQGWSDLYRFDVGQGDGMQRLEIAPDGDGIAAVWTEGRTDRRVENDPRPRGVFLGSIVEGKSAPAGADLLVSTADSPSKWVPPSANAPVSRFETGGKEYQLVFGDLHRHTDLSLCRVPVDGTLDDCYRYAIDVAKLDFLGITDHARDIAFGDQLSLLWWRCCKEVNRHWMPSYFSPFYSYERSGQGADHNVISLHTDVLRPHTYPHPEFWKEFGTDVIMIPHIYINPVIWDEQDDLRRPLLEIFQGCRTVSIEKDAHDGLSRGYLLGFIASSDHVSTGASFACVWAERPNRESIFRGLQNRRTYGATARIYMKVVAGGHWMGETFETETMPPLEIDVVGTAPIEDVKFIVDGVVHETLHPGKQHVTLRQELDLSGKHYVYIHIKQRDGHQAWSSPIWVNVVGS